jgi:hypothetical protein
MTEEDLRAIIDGIAPVLRAEISTLQARLGDLETRCQALEHANQVLEAQVLKCRDALVVALHERRADVVTSLRDLPPSLIRVH